jgi:hypothetical protein
MTPIARVGCLLMQQVDPRDGVKIEGPQYYPEVKAEASRQSPRRAATGWQLRTGVDTVREKGDLL